MENQNKKITETLRLLRLRAEDGLKAQVSEHVLNQLHEGPYKQVKESIAPIRNILSDNRHIELESAIIDLRVSLNTNPKEREVHNRLLEFEKLARVRTASLSEVYISKPSGRTGRIDILALPDTEEAHNKGSGFYFCHQLFVMSAFPFCCIYYILISLYSRCI